MPPTLRRLALAGAALLALAGCTDVVTAPVDVAATAVETTADVTGETLETTTEVATP
jgi:hypothetical protein